LYDKNREIVQSLVSIDPEAEVQAIYGMDTPLAGSMLSLNTRQRTYSVSSHKSNLNKWGSNASITKRDRRAGSELRDIAINNSANKPYNPVMTTEKDEPKKLSCWQKFLDTIVKIFDLELLKDPIYVNIMFGMSLAVYAELNFSLLTPLILNDFNMETQQIATFLSVLSIADIIFRFLAPFIGDFLKVPARIMYMIALVMLIATRFTLIIFTREYVELLIVAVGLGVAKGVRSVYWTLVIPAYVPIERLANASGIQMVVNGVIILIGGPILGWIRDQTGSYYKCVYVMNMVTMCTLTIWTIELLYVKYKRPKKEAEITS